MTNNNLYTWRVVFRLSATFMFTILFFTSCKKTNNPLGASSIDKNELLNSIQLDTFTIETTTTFEDSVVTSNNPAGILGSYNDPKFGECKAGFYTQLRLPSVNPNFGDISTIAIDSFVLGLEYLDNGFYGDLSTQTVEAYELIDSLGRNSTYYSFTNKETSIKNLVDPNHKNIVPDPYTKTVIDTTHVPAQMRIYLDTNLAKKLIEEAANNPTTFSSNDNFLNFFKGLYVGVNNGSQSSGSGGVLYFNLEIPLSKLTIYYKQAGEKKKYDFVLNSSCAKYNKVEIENPSSLIGNQSIFYAQALKSRASIKLPGIANLPKKIIIHEAQLKLPVEYQTGKKYAPGDMVAISSRFIGGKSKLYGIGVGFYDAFNKEFILDLRAYVQGIVSNERFAIPVDGMALQALIEGTEIFITPDKFNSSLNRIIFNGSNTINKNKPKLTLKYTQF